MFKLLPVHAFVDDGPLIDKGLRNYWGYNSIGFFAPMPRYLSSGEISDFRSWLPDSIWPAWKSFLMSYNHTAEGNELDPRRSFKGVDNATYYRLQNDRRYYINDTGTGNTFNVAEPRVSGNSSWTASATGWKRCMSTGSASILRRSWAREPTGFDPHSGFLHACRQDPVLSTTKLIAEPWDVGPGGHQVGHFPPGWAEWNDRYRDTVRAYWRGDFGQRGDFAAVLCASTALFGHRGRRPWASINYVTAHDGFTLNYLVSYNDKHNEANGEQQPHGTDNNLSWNHGEEGNSPDPDVNALRDQQKRNFLATLLFSTGTPMLLGGDELGHTQRGNNAATRRTTRSAGLIGNPCPLQEWHYNGSRSAWSRSGANTHSFGKSNF